MSDRSTVRSSRLAWSDTIFEAASVILQRPVRTALTALGTILGVGAFVATTGLATTARAQVSAEFDALAATEVRVRDGRPDGTNPFPDDVERRLEVLNGIRHAGLMFVVPSAETLRARNAVNRVVPSNTLAIIAASPGAVGAALPTVTTGRLYNEFHQTRAERVAVLGRLSADQLGIFRVDNAPAVFLGDTSFTVVGIIDDVERNPELLLSVIIPTTTAAAEFDLADTAYEVLIDTDPGAARLAGEQAPIALSPQDPERLQTLLPPDPTGLRNSIESNVTSLYYSLSVLALIIGTVAIANATLLNTIERRAEIGLRRALGATRRHIVRQITLEAATIGTLAAVVGTALAIVAIAVVAATRDWALTLDPVVTVTAPLIGLATGTIAGILPAHRAARTPPATTLRS